MVMEGTGGLVYSRTLNLPVNFETHIAPRTPGDPVQSFDTDMFPSSSRDEVVDSLP